MFKAASPDEGIGSEPGVGFKLADTIRPLFAIRNFYIPNLCHRGNIVPKGNLLYYRATQKSFFWSAMPLFWRFLLTQYLKISFLSTVAFVAVLLTTRLDDITHFATLGASWTTVFFFTMNQLPYILPIAIPVSCLIASIIMIKQLSNSHELTALRSCGLSLKQILLPIMMASAYIALGNFYIVSELATRSHKLNNSIKTELRSDNPLLVLHHRQLLRNYGIFYEALGPSKMGESAHDAILAAPKGDDIQLFVSKSLEVGDGVFSGEDVAFISPLGHVRDGFDPLLLENISEMEMPALNFSDLVQKKIGKINNDYLNFALLRAKIAVEQEPKAIDKAYVEICRRISVAFAVISFTLLGCAFGINISRQRSYRGMIVVILLAALYLACYFGGKGVNTSLKMGILLYVVPHILIIGASLTVLKRIQKGLET